MNNKLSSVNDQIFTDINQINIELLKHLNDLNNFCLNNNMFILKIKRINDYVVTTYPDIQYELEKRFPKVYSMNGFKNHIDVLINILIDIINNDIKQNYYLELTEKKANIGISFINTINLYLNKKIDINAIKNNLFLIAHEIKPEKFQNLNLNGLLALCEMSENGVDVNQYENAGNLRLIFLNEVANGGLKNKQDEAIKKEQIILSIEKCLNGSYIEELEYNNNFSLIFQLNEKNGISIYTNDNLVNSIAELDENGDFIKGNLNIILSNIYKNIEPYNEENYNFTNSIDKIISQYNSTFE